MHRILFQNFNTELQHKMKESILKQPSLCKGVKKKTQPILFNCSWVYTKANHLQLPLLDRNWSGI